ncbi:MAG: site-2 protease family protein [Candidatus Pacearchaeota archaeon]|nr:site-2 protease family protein [Candidatus Pacearchaeota archaeon]
MYRTKLGIRLMDWISKKFPRLLNTLSYVSITFGFLAMIFALIFLFLSIKAMTAIVTVPKIPPLMPLVPYLPEIFNLPLPPFYFSYWIVIILIVAVTHEFAHGIFARYFGLKIKSTGFGFLGPFLAAFVEPDEKALQKKSKRAQLSVISAGSFSNCIFAIIFLLILPLFFSLSTVPSSILYATTSINVSDIESLSIDSTEFRGFTKEEILPHLGETNELVRIKAINNSVFFATQETLKQQIDVPNEISTLNVFYDGPLIRANIQGEIKEINGIKVRDYDKIFQNLSLIQPGQVVTIKTTVSEYEIVAIEHPKNSSKGFIGIGSMLLPVTGLTKRIQDFTSPIKNPFMLYKSKYNEDIFVFFFNMLWWLALACFSMALINMLPLGILDGGRFIYITVLWLTNSKKVAERIFRLAAFLVLLLFLTLMVIWVIRAF